MTIKIKKRLLKNFPEEKYPLNQKGKQLSMVGAYELIQDAYGFLKTFCRGCYDAYLIRVDYKSVLICIENFAIIIKGLVKAVFGRQLIIIRFTDNGEYLYMDFEFNTDFVSDELREEMRVLAKEGGFAIDFSEGSVRIKIRYIQNSLPYVNSISTRIVYNTMSYIFHSKEF